MVTHGITMTPDLTLTFMAMIGPKKWRGFLQRKSFQLLRKNHETSKVILFLASDYFDSSVSLLRLLLSAKSLCSEVEVGRPGGRRYSRRIRIWVRGRSSLLNILGIGWLATAPTMRVSCRRIVQYQRAIYRVTNSDWRVR